MKLLIDLFTTDYGLMSITGLFIILIMAGYFTRLFLGKVGGGAPQEK